MRSGFQEESEEMTKANRSRSDSVTGRRNFSSRIPRLSGSKPGSRFGVVTRRMTTSHELTARQFDRSGVEVFAHERAALEKVDDPMAFEGSSTVSVATVNPN